MRVIRREIQKYSRYLAHPRYSGYNFSFLPSFFGQRFFFGVGGEKTRLRERGRNQSKFSPHRSTATQKTNLISRSCLWPQISCFDCISISSSQTLERDLSQTSETAISLSREKWTLGTERNSKVIILCCPTENSSSSSKEEGRMLNIFQLREEGEREDHWSPRKLRCERRGKGTRKG